MRKMFKNVVNEGKSILYRVKDTVSMAKVVLSNNRAEGFIDSGVKILIAVVIGALLLGGLYTLFGTTILPTLTNKITSLFNYSG